jgi:hypothetical protein
VVGRRAVGPREWTPDGLSRDGDSSALNGARDMSDSAIDYAALAVAAGAHAESWDAFVRTALVGPWLEIYDAVTPWATEVLEIRQRSVVFLFDAALTTRQLTSEGAASRVVAAWGSSATPEMPRDRARMAGFLRLPETWSGRRLDRGHFVAHAAGGALDLNLFPQASHLNRGRSKEGRLWRRMERYAATHPGTPLFVRPTYDGGGWTPAALELGLLLDTGVWCERFSNQA